jgi:hypothetical protein
MQILNYNIQTCMGEVTSRKDQLNFLSNEEQKEFDLIGYTGKNSQGLKIGRVEYLNSLRPDKEQFKIIQTKFDSGDFIEEFILTRVII